MHFTLPRFYPQCTSLSLSALHLLCLSTLCSSPACHSYTTTLHAINSLIVKTSKLTTVTKVYRGVAGGPIGLPSYFWPPNSQGVSGGIEASFLSCTTDKERALAYAAGGGGNEPGSERELSKPGVVLECSQSMASRGACLHLVHTQHIAASCLSHSVPLAL